MTEHAWSYLRRLMENRGHHCWFGSSFNDAAALFVSPGHRIVHDGPKYFKPQRITPEMVEELHHLSSFDPDHLPEESIYAEAETASLATSWQSNKFLDPITDGAVLPIPHLNGYKISNPTVTACAAGIT